MLKRKLGLIFALLAIIALPLAGCGEKSDVDRAADALEEGAGEAADAMRNMGR